MRRYIVRRNDGFLYAKHQFQCAACQKWIKPGTRVVKVRADYGHPACQPKKQLFDVQAATRAYQRNKRRLDNS